MLHYLHMSYDQMRKKPPANIYQSTLCDIAYLQKVEKKHTQRGVHHLPCGIERRPHVFHTLAACAEAHRTCVDTHTSYLSRVLHVILHDIQRQTLWINQLCRSPMSRTSLDIFHPLMSQGRLKKLNIYLVIGNLWSPGPCRGNLEGHPGHANESVSLMRSPVPRITTVFPSSSGETHRVVYNSRVISKNVDDLPDSHWPSKISFVFETSIHVRKHIYVFHGQRVF